MDYLLHFMPVSYIRGTVIPTTNQYAKQQDPWWIDVDFNDFLHVLGHLFTMEIYEIHGPPRQYWFAEMNDLFPSINFNKVLSYKRFEKIMLYLRLSNADNEDQQVLDFLTNINQNFQNCVIPGSYLTPDKSMLKSFHQNLKGKIKIIRKPHPVGSEIKNMANGASQLGILRRKRCNVPKRLCEALWCNNCHNTVTSSAILWYWLSCHCRQLVWLSKGGS